MKLLLFLLNPFWNTWIIHDNSLPWAKEWCQWPWCSWFESQGFCFMMLWLKYSPYPILTNHATVCNIRPKDSLWCHRHGAPHPGTSCKHQAVLSLEWHWIHVSIPSIWHFGHGPSHTKKLKNEDTGPFTKISLLALLALLIFILLFKWLVANWCE